MATRLLANSRSMMHTSPPSAVGVKTYIISIPWSDTVIRWVLLVAIHKLAGLVADGTHSYITSLTVKLRPHPPIRITTKIKTYKTAWSRWSQYHCIKILSNFEQCTLGSRTLCFIATLLCYSFIPDNFTNYAQLSSPLCPMCTQLLRDSSDRVGALSRSSNDMWTPSPWAYYPSSDMSCCKSQTLRSSC